MHKKQDDYEVVAFPRIRAAALDLPPRGERMHIIHAVAEVDVTEPRHYIREHRARTGEPLSFTAFIATCLGKAVDENKYLHAYRNWRNQLVIFSDVDVATMIERERDGLKMAVNYVIRAANTKTFRQIHQEIRAAQVEDVGQFAGLRGVQRVFWALPTFIRGFFWWALVKSPHLWKKVGGTVGVTAIGMFGKGVGWGIPMSVNTLTVTLGGIAEKPGVVDGRIRRREYLSMTLSFDHDIIDGAPAARFTQRLKELVETGYGLTD